MVDLTLDHRRHDVSRCRADLGEKVTGRRRLASSPKFPSPRAHILHAIRHKRPPSPTTTRLHALARLLRKALTSEPGVAPASAAIEVIAPIFESPETPARNGINANSWSNLGPTRVGFSRGGRGHSDLSRRNPLGTGPVSEGKTAKLTHRPMRRGARSRSSGDP